MVIAWWPAPDQGAIRLRANDPVRLSLWQDPAYLPNNCADRGRAQGALHKFWRGVHALE